MNAAIIKAIETFKANGGYATANKESILFDGIVATNCVTIYNMPNGEFFARVNGRPACESRVLGLFDRHEMFRNFPA